MQLFISSRRIFDCNVHQCSLRVYPLDHLEHVFMLTTVLKLLDKHSTQQDYRALFLAWANISLIPKRGLMVSWFGLWLPDLSVIFIKGPSNYNFEQCCFFNPGCTFSSHSFSLDILLFNRFIFIECLLCDRREGPFPLTQRSTDWVL